MSSQHVETHTGLEWYSGFPRTCMRKVDLVCNPRRPLMEGPLKVILFLTTERQPYKPCSA